MLWQSWTLVGADIAHYSAPTPIWPKDGCRMREQVDCQWHRQLLLLLGTNMVTVDGQVLVPIYHIFPQDARLACYCGADRRTTEYVARRRDRVKYASKRPVTNAYLMQIVWTVTDHWPICTGPLYMARLLVIMASMGHNYPESIDNKKLIKKKKNSLVSSDLRK